MSKISNLGTAIIRQEYERRFGPIEELAGTSSEVWKQLRPWQSKEPHQCNCPTVILMAKGCQCGGT